MVEIKNTKPITLEEAKRILENRIKEGEITFEQQTALEYAKKFSKVSIEDVRELRKLLSEIIQDEAIIVKIIDILPTNQDLLQAILSKEEIVLKKEDVGKIIEICTEYRKKNSKQPAQHLPKSE